MEHVSEERWCPKGVPHQLVDLDEVSVLHRYLEIRKESGVVTCAVCLPMTHKNRLCIHVSAIEW